MPRLLPNEEMLQIPGATYQFSAVRTEELEATEYTLVTIVIDISGSVYSYSTNLLKMLKEVVKACEKNPRSENLMIRLLTFNTQLQEVHGFRTLEDIDPDAYQELNCGGGTSLYDATYTAIEATNVYGKSLTDSDFTANGAIYIITDGSDNSSTSSRKMIAEAIDKSRSDEIIESLITILVGVNTSECGSYLDKFHKDSKLDQYVDMGDATASRLAKLGGWISKSISSQSQSLGTGGPSQQISLTF